MKIEELNVPLFKLAKQLDLSSVWMLRIKERLCKKGNDTTIESLGFALTIKQQKIVLRVTMGLKEE